jgi:hypothetical protein
MRRREFMTSFGATAAWPLAAHAQQSAKIRRIGYLDYGAGILPNGGYSTSTPSPPFRKRLSSWLIVHLSSGSDASSHIGSWADCIPLRPTLSPPRGRRAANGNERVKRVG